VDAFSRYYRLYILFFKLKLRKLTMQISLCLKRKQTYGWNWVDFTCSCVPAFQTITFLIKKMNSLASLVLFNSILTSYINESLLCVKSHLYDYSNMMQSLIGSLLVVFNILFCLTLVFSLGISYPLSYL